MPDDNTYTEALTDASDSSGSDFAPASEIREPNWDSDENTDSNDDQDARERRIHEEIDPLLNPLLDAWKNSGHSEPVKWPDADPAHSPYFGTDVEAE
jgi:hypothetical protein